MAGRFVFRRVLATECRSHSSPSRTRTCDPLINSQLLYQLSYRGIEQTYEANPVSRVSQPTYAGHDARTWTRFSRR